MFYAAMMLFEAMFSVSMASLCKFKEANNDQEYLGTIAWSLHLTCLMKRFSEYKP